MEELKKSYFIETVSGIYVNPEDPDPATLLIHDMAWALSRTARFAGHTLTSTAYNNAQHSVFVANMVESFLKKANLRLTPEVENELILFGLLHDCGECYVGDVPSPVKRIPTLKEAFAKIEDRLLDMIYTKFVGRLPTDEEWKTVKHFDIRACQIEAFTFMRSRGIGKHWGVNKVDIDLLELQSFPTPEPSIESYQKFINKFNELTDH